MYLFLVSLSKVEMILFKTSEWVWDPFATYPLLAGAEKAHMIFNIVFFVSLTSVIVQGTSLPVIAKWLRLTLINLHNQIQIK